MLRVNSKSESMKTRNMKCFIKSVNLKKGESHMAERKQFETLLMHTKNVAVIWKNTRGISPDEVADKLDKAMLEWMRDLTQSLKIWIDKGQNMTDGELILARANLGSVVESWLRLFYTVFIEDYNKNPILDSKGKTVPLHKANFVDLQKYSCNILWADKNSKEYMWVDSVRKKRNAIHSFEEKDIGTPQDFIEDINELYSFVEKVMSHFPPVEDCMDVLPYGYQLCSMF